MKSRHLTFVSAIIALAVSASAALAAPAITTAHVNVRTGPGTSFPAVGALTANSRIEIGDCRNGFCNLVGRDGPGWVSQTYLSFSTGPVPPSAWPQPPQPPSSWPGPRPGQPGPWPGAHPQPAPWPGSQPHPAPWPKGPGAGHLWPSRPWPAPQPQPWPLPVPPPPEYEESGACFYSSSNFIGESMCLDAGESLDSLPRLFEYRIRSVEVFGDAKVDLCSDPGFYGTCITLRSGAARLPRVMDGRAASVEVY